MKQRVTSEDIACLINALNIFLDGAYLVQIYDGAEDNTRKLIMKFRNKKNLILSNDFNGYENQWIRKIKNFAVFKQVILMFIKNVGGRGVNWRILKKIKKDLSPKKTIVAGGIKYNGDVKILSLLGYNSIVISSFIHKKIASMGEKPPMGWLL